MEAVALQVTPLGAAEWKLLLCGSRRSAQPSGEAFSLCKLQSKSGWSKSPPDADKEAIAPRPQTIKHRALASARELLGPDGPFPQGKYRTSLRAIVDDGWRKPVEEAIADQQILIAEAGTGTGKTFAYLVPALQSGKRVIVSTGTKNLQDQLFHRDLPRVRDVLGARLRRASQGPRQLPVLVSSGTDAQGWTPDFARAGRSVAGDPRMEPAYG